MGSFTMPRHLQRAQSDCPSAQLYLQCPPVQIGGHSTRVCVDWVFCLSGDEESHRILSTLLHVTGIWSERVPLAIRKIEDGHKLHSEMPQSKTKQYKTKQKKKQHFSLVWPSSSWITTLSLSKGWAKLEKSSSYWSFRMLQFLHSFIIFAGGLGGWHLCLVLVKKLDFI